MPESLWTISGYSVYTTYLGIQGAARSAITLVCTVHQVCAKQHLFKLSTSHLYTSCTGGRTGKVLTADVLQGMESYVFYALVVGLLFCLSQIFQVRNHIFAGLAHTHCTWTDPPTSTRRRLEEDTWPSEMPSHKPASQVRSLDRAADASHKRPASAIWWVAKPWPRC